MGYAVRTATHRYVEWRRFGTTEIVARELYRYEGEQLFETENLAETIRNIRDRYGCTVLLVEHDMRLVMGVCERICAISFGKFLALGTPAEIQANPLVQEAYLGAHGE